MLPGAKKPTGELFVTDVKPIEFFSAGIGVTTNGAVCITSDVSGAVFSSGFLVSPEGRLCVSVSVVKVLKDGIARGNDGEVVVSYGVPSPTSTFVGGVRVTRDGKIHVSADSPPTFNSFSDGFSTGFG